MTLSQAEYEDLTDRFLRAVRGAVPSDAVVAVISKGDDRLLSLGAATAWHFPRRSDGLYAGHYPADASSAVKHLEALRAKGAQFLAVPATATWWLDHYRDFCAHLERNYRLVASDDRVGRLYTLFQPGQRHAGSAGGAVPEDWVPAARDEAPFGLEQQIAEEAQAIFDQEHYERQAGIRFSSVEVALAHYLGTGYLRGWDPHPLFDTAFYLRLRPQAKAAGVVPLLDFLTHGRTEALDPCPYFDSAYYAEQARISDRGGVGALLHFLSASADTPPADPNPLFHARYYLREVPAARALGMNPLVHYLTRGAGAGVAVSTTHKSIVKALAAGQTGAGLRRGRWINSTVLVLAAGARSTSEPLLRIAECLAEHHHSQCLVLSLQRPDDLSGRRAGPTSICLEDYETASDVLRPSALRMLLRTLVGLSLDCAVTDVPAALPVLRKGEVPSLFLGDHLATLPSGDLTDVVALADRIVFPSAKVFTQITATLGAAPTKGTVRPRPRPVVAAVGREAMGGEGGDLDRYAEQVIQLLPKEPVSSGAGETERATDRAGRPRVVVPCSDWSVSGVNASLHALGTQLLDMGWDIEILFTRDRQHVIESAGGEEHLPGLPFRFLKRRRRGVEGMWTALIADLESAGPSILFMSYDFLANSAVPALTEHIGVVTWVQSDDGDYYEQAYRLGRYCNGVVSVSSHIRASIIELNPALGDRTHVIHNASVWASDVVSRKKASPHHLRLVYAGRLVQYQKRILDFLELASALDEREVPYTITLIGDFNPREGISEQFRLDAWAHLADGRIVLPGRLSRDRILDELAGHDFFLLLSDFEGLPLSLVEAMARGCVPVTAKMDSGVPEVVTSGENGLIVEDRDYGKWADLIIERWREPAEFRRLSKNARRKVLRDFTVEQAAEKYDALFRSVGAQMAQNTFVRPPSLHWGAGKSRFGDVLPPPTMYKTGQVNGLS